MTPNDWRSIQTRVEALWGSARKWKEAAALSSRVARIKYETANQVVDDLVLTEKNEPSPALIIGMCKARAGDTGPVTRPGQEDCTHESWAIVEYQEHGFRLGVCRGCLLERRFKPGKLLMRWERDQKRVESQVEEVF